MKSGFEAYQAGEYHYAVIMFRKAGEQAREHKDESGWFEAMVWGAEAYRCMGKAQQALGLLLIARAEEPPGSGWPHWMCRRMQLEISLALEPIRSNLEAMLADLEELFHRGRFARQDLHILRGELSSERGQWADAIAHFERGFAAFVDDDEPGFTKRTCSSWAASACLAERRLAAAQDWIEAMQDMSEWGSGWDKSIRVWQAYYRLRLARARCAPFSELRSLLREFDDVMYGQDGAIAVDNLYIERARVGILDPQGGDPARPTHQSRNACRDYPIRRSNCHSRFDRSLLVVDYRLACLRFAVGIGPVDDEFDKTSPPLVKLIPPDGRDFGQRLDKAGAALRRARECATQLDAMLECDWRTKEVEARAIWIRAIGAAAAG